jgi:hypothetical protein
MAKAKKEEAPKRSKGFMCNMREDVYKKMGYIAVMDEKDKTDIVEEALLDYISKYEKKNGQIPIR